MNATASEPINSTNAVTPASLHWNGEDDWRCLLRKLLKNGKAGILSTIDTRGHPHVRWMSTISSDYYPNLYALTSADSSKVREIRAHPEVTWMFFTEDLSLIANLSGTARVLTDVASKRMMYRELPEESREAFVDCHLKGETVVLETLVTTIEVTSPANYFRHAGPASELRLGERRIERFDDRSILEA